MESGTYAQIHYNPDDLDDVCVTKVEEPVSEEVPADAKTENMEESAVEKPEFQEESAEEDLQNVQSEEVQDRVASDQENDIFLEIEPESEKELEHTAEDEKIPVEGSEQPSDVKSGEVQSLQALAKLQDSLQRFAEANEDIQRTLRRLERKFTDEILNGENRDSSVKTIYKELNEYKAGIVEKALKNVLYDIVDIRETMLSQARFLREKKGADSISLDEFESYADDIGDILEKHDVTIYKGEIGEENVAVRQKIVRKSETEDDNLVKKVAESLSYGYEYGGKILYPEKISVYVKKK